MGQQDPGFPSVSGPNVAPGYYMTLEIIIWLIIWIKRRGTSRTYPSFSVARHILIHFEICATFKALLQCCSPWWISVTVFILTERQVQYSSPVNGTFGGLWSLRSLLCVLSNFLSRGCRKFKALKWPPSKQQGGCWKIHFNTSYVLTSLYHVWCRDVYQLGLSDLIILKDTKRKERPMLENLTFRD